MVRPVSSGDRYVTFRGVSVAVAASNYQRVARCCSTHVVCTLTVPGECYGGASRALWTVGQSSGYTYWTLDSDHLSLSSPPHHPGCLTVGRVASVRRRTTTAKGGSNPPVFPVTRADVYARTPIAHRFLHIIYARVDIYRETRNVRT